MDKLNKLINELSGKFNYIIKQFLVVIGYLLLTFGLQFFLFQNNDNNNLILLNLSSLFINLFILVIFVFIFRKTLIPDFYEFKKNSKNLIKDYFIYWIIGFALSTIFLNIISAYAGEPSTQTLNETYVLTFPFYSIINMIIIAPIFEELLTKVYFKNAFKNKYIYIILSGILFGSLHLLTPGSNWLHAIPYAVLGGTFSLMYYKSNNIWTNIFYHSLHNALAVIVVFIGNI